MIATAPVNVVRPIARTLSAVAAYCDEKKVGDAGALGFRRSTDLAKLVSCLLKMIEMDLLVPGESRFLDLGCADGRVNVLLSYLAKLSVGIELNDWILEEYGPLRRELEASLGNSRLPLPPENIFLFHGDSTDELLHEAIKEKTRSSFADFDLFYTYLTMQEEFAEMVARKARRGALFMVYGLDRILPRFKGLHLLTPEKSMEGILALYRKE